MTNVLLLATNLLFTDIDTFIANCLTNTTAPEIEFTSGTTIWDPVETVCLVTNVTTWDNGFTAPSLQWYWPTNNYILTHGEITSGDAVYLAPMQCQPPTEKTETTEIVEVRTLRFRWNDKPCELTQEKVLSRKVRRWVRKDAWVEQ